MSFLVSPGVHVKEIDLTNVVPAVATTIGAMALPGDRGPVSSVVTIGSEEELLATFGKPNGVNFEWWFTASNFLHYSDQLKIVRPAASASVNAITLVGGTALLVRDDDHYEVAYSAGQASVGEWIARTAGAWGNSLGVSYCATAVTYDAEVKSKTSGAGAAGDTTIGVDSGPDFTEGDIISFYQAVGLAVYAVGHEGVQYEVIAIATNTLTIRKLDDAKVPNDGLVAILADDSAIRRKWRYYDLFDRAPGTTQWATDNGRAEQDEIFVVVFDTTGDIGGSDGSIAVAGNRTGAVLETFIGSKNPKAKTAQGSNNYLPDVIFTSSKYIYWMDWNAAGDAGNWGNDAAGTGLATALVNNSGLNNTTALAVDTNAGATLVDGMTVTGAKIIGNVTITVTNQTTLVMSSAQTLDNNTPLTFGTAYTTLGTGIVLPALNELILGAPTTEPTLTAGEIALAYDEFKDTESLDVNLVLGGPGGGHADTAASQDTHVTMITDLCELRKDCVGFVSPYRSATVNVSSSITQTANVVEAFDLCPSSSYMVFDSGYKYMYDKYNDVYRYVPLNGDIGGLCANTDKVADPWFSPAGYNRGHVRGAIKLSYNPKNSERDQLYRARINPVTNFPGQGVVLFGDKTALAAPSAFDRINVRRLFLVLEKAIATAAKYQLFEFNDEFTRAQFRAMVEPFLRDVQGRRGIFEFSVVCDGTNNTGEVIDRNEFIGDIYIKPARSINFITLNFIAVRTGVAFSEVGG